MDSIYRQRVFLEDRMSKAVISTNKKIRKYKNNNYQTLNSILLAEIKSSLYGYFSLYVDRPATDSSRFVKSCYWSIKRFPNGDIESVECVPKKKGDDLLWGGGRSWIENLSSFINSTFNGLDMDGLSFQSRGENIEEFNTSLVPVREKQYQPDFSIPILDFGALSSIKFQ